MNDVTTTFWIAMEQAGMLALCREGQLEIAVETVRREYPSLSIDAVNELVEAEAGN